MDTPKIPEISRIGPAKFLKEVKQELKKVSWPTREETIKLTTIVIVLSVIVAIFIGAVDMIFLKTTSTLFRR